MQKVEKPNNLIKGLSLKQNNQYRVRLPMCEGD